jgi:UDP-N-acetylmuramoylalanine--D-glutamate ligase
VARSIQKRGGTVDITDDNAAGALLPKDINLQEYDAVVISPGWRQDHPLVLKVLATGMKLLNEVDLAWLIRNEIAPHQNG